MLLGRQILFLEVCALVLVSGCGSSTVGTEAGSITAAPTGTTTTMTGGSTTGTVTFNSAAGVSGTHDSVIGTSAVPQVAVVAGASQTVSFNFGSSDGALITGFGISQSLSVLPVGWSGPSSFVCAAVSTGNGCVLNLTYSPAAAGDSGTVTLNYVFVDNAKAPNTTGSMTFAYGSTASDNVLATASPTGQVAAAVGKGAQSVTVGFTTDDGNAATDLIVTTDLTALPFGWSTTTPAFTCAIVSTGSGCDLMLSYSPTAAGGGILHLNYVYVDEAGVAKTGSLNIPYVTSSANTVVATASPAGQVIAVQKSGGQAVAVTFTTDDGQAASNLSVTSNLKALPAGWSSAATGLSCGSVSTGNGCQLSLKYAPTALASGTLALNYAYTNAAGAAKTGLLNIVYAATTNDNVVGTVAPSGQINAVVGMGAQGVTVTFGTDDGRPATALLLTSSLASLPAGWSSTATSFSCSGLNSDNVCQLPLTYAPTAAGNGTVTLTYSYKNNDDLTKTGTVAIPYRGTTNDTVVGTASSSALSVRTGSSTPVTVTFTTNDANPASALTVTSGLATLPAGWSSPVNSLTCATVSAGTTCELSLTYSPMVGAVGGALTLGFSYANDSDIPGTGSTTITYNAVTPYLFVANSTGNTVSSCPINFDDSVQTCAVAASFGAPQGIAMRGSSAYVTGSLTNAVVQCAVAQGSLSGCAATGGSLLAPSAIALSPTGNFAYVDQLTTLDFCAIAPADGTLSGCAPTAGVLNDLYGIAISPDDAHAYSVNVITTGIPPLTISIPAVEVCSVAANGSVFGCAVTGTNTGAAKAVLGIKNNWLYLSTTTGGLYSCPLNADATVGTCQVSMPGTPINGIAFGGTMAYLSTGSNVLACTLNADGTTTGCTTVTDPSFSGTAGLAVR